MRYVVAMFMTVILVLTTAISASASPAITADAAILLDGTSGQILYEKNIHKQRPPASTTKIMTALLAIEGTQLEQIAKISPKAAAVGEASIDLQANEEITVWHLLYGAMLHSGNDACVAIAEHVAGTEENFISLMNFTAKKLGAVNTNFCNPNGLPNPAHYSTAYDLAIIAKYAMGNSDFRKIVGTRNISITGPENGQRYLSNTNRLLWGYSGVDGIKTGTTNTAGCCLVSSARKDGRHLITVVLASADRYHDTVKLLDYGFQAFEEVVVAAKGDHITTIDVVGGTDKKVAVMAARDLSILVLRGQEKDLKQKISLVCPPLAPVQAHTNVGYLTVLINNQKINELDLVTAQKIARQSPLKLIHRKSKEK